MTYTTARGVTTYADHDTPPEFATGADEDAAAFNVYRDTAFSDAETLMGLLDDLYDRTDATKAGAMQALAVKVAALVADARALSA